jgi:hypothetical protein
LRFGLRYTWGRRLGLFLRRFRHWLWLLRILLGILLNWLRLRRRFFGISSRQRELCESFLGLAGIGSVKYRWSG